MEISVSEILLGPVVYKASILEKFVTYPFVLSHSMYNLNSANLSKEHKMSSSLNSRFLAKIVLLVSCLALLDRRSDALLLGNLIGCNSFGCRLTNLETEVAHLKQQVARMGDHGQMNNQHQNQMLPYNQHQNQNQLPNQSLLNQQGTNSNQLNGGNTPNQQQQQNPGGSSSGPRVNYANLLQDYPVNQQQMLRRVADYQNGLSNQFS